MKKKLSLIAIVSLVIFVFVKCNNPKSEPVADQASKENFSGFGSQVKWGEHLVTVSACHDCHSPKKGFGLDSAHLLAGYMGTPVADVHH